MKLIVKTFEEFTPAELYELLKCRIGVFVVEQNCPYQELDDLDYRSVHVYYLDDAGKIAAYLRLFEKDPASHTVQMGRVLSVQRGTGLGGRILREGMHVAMERLQARTICIEAQQYAVGFYEREGFRPCSDVFLEDGIPHVKMERQAPSHQASCKEESHHA